MTAYYNEHEPYAAQWLRNLIDAGLIADGVVDERSIIDVRPDDLTGFCQCHFFAGIGGWSHALRLAGWPDDRPVWTGSPPCQPFSTAGLQLGKDDERHLAPTWLNLVSECDPAIVFGEQVEAAIRKGWLDDLQIHLEAEGYAVGALVLPGCSVGTPHLRQRQWIIAEELGDPKRDRQHRPQGFTPEPISDGADWRLPVGGSSPALGLVNSGDPGLEGHDRHVEDSGQPGREQTEPTGSARETSRPCQFCGFAFDHEALGKYGCPNCEGGGLADADGSTGREDAGSAYPGEATHNRTERNEGEKDRDHRSASHGEDYVLADAQDSNGRGGERRTQTGARSEEVGRRGSAIGSTGNSLADTDEDGRDQGRGCEREAGNDGSLGDAGLPERQPPAGPTNGFWGPADWLYCQDGKWRPVEPGTFPLAHGVPARVGKLRAYGNAIIPQVAAEVIAAFMDYQDRAE